MSRAFFLGRFCTHQLPRQPVRGAFFTHLRSTFQRNISPKTPQWRVGRIRTVTLRASATGALGTAAFVQLSEVDNNGTNQTGELRMLEASREEIRKGVPEEDRGLTRFRHTIIWLFDVYFWEPVCTSLRFLHLVAIFVPVIAAVPMIWIGRRQPDRDNERSGTLLWYKFLVQAMEWAGPAFIKVIFHYLYSKFE
jgi:aarF domain-containing kinase